MNSRHISEGIIDFLIPACVQTVPMFTCVLLPLVSPDRPQADIPSILRTISLLLGPVELTAFTTNGERIGDTITRTTVVENG